MKNENKYQRKKLNNVDGNGTFSMAPKNLRKRNNYISFPCSLCTKFWKS